MFHYALKPDGFLLLGSAESIGKHAEMFRGVEAKSKLYVPKANAAMLPHHFSAPVARHRAASEAAGTERAGPPAPTRDLTRVVDRVLMKRYCPASVVVNEQLDIVQFRGQTGEFLEPAPGEASFNLPRMARDGLAMELRDIVGQAIRTHAPARKDGIPFRGGGDARLIEIHALPLDFPGSAFFLVVFRATRTAPATAEPPGRDARDDARVALLERELGAAKDHLQSVIEQGETIHEELRSANEEIVSSNEELQSTNEELETAKEELQSVNEELSTVNDELEMRNRELMQVNGDLSNVIATVNVPVVIVGPDLRIRRFTPLAEKHLNLVAGDVGRLIDDVTLGISVPELRAVAEDVIATVSASQIEGAARDGRWYSVRVRPYRTLDNKIDGATLAFIDIDETRRALTLAQDARDYAQGIVDAIRHPILVLDANLTVVSANPAFHERFGVAPAETVGNLVYHLGKGQWGIPRLRALLEGVCRRGVSFDDYRVEHEFETIGVRRFRISGRPIGAASGAGKPCLVLVQIEPQGDDGPGGFQGKD